MSSPLKKILMLTAVLLSTLQAQGSPSEEKKPDGWRVWTDEETKRTIEGVITDKHKDGTRITIRKDTGGYLRVEIACLIEKDQDFAKKWVKAQDAITVTTKASRRGGEKVIKVRAMAGTKPMLVKVLTGAGLKTLTYKLEAGEDRQFEVTVYKGYDVVGYHGGKEIDREDALKKTGLQE